MIRRPPRSTLSSSSAASDVYKRQQFQDMGRKSHSQGKMFGQIGVMFGLADCIIEKWRGKHDSWNGTYSGFVVGGVLAIRGGPSSALMGALGFGAFSFVADSVMHGFMGEKPDPRVAKREKQEELELAREIPPTANELALLVQAKTLKFQRDSVSVQW
eukprot:TRINITY_DN37765_c0_g1_i1.p1 TRINITY_DN37765_c0_g1~~TRINITY_DN37765_c0_g1_i1.p1  ORF type:complete len:158 (+),score=38.54 TRINITY_DN37765_c0_g1_i1:97-570(+)